MSDFHDHAWGFVIEFVAFAAFVLVTGLLPWWLIPGGLLFFLIANPDLDQRLFPSQHRSGFTHSPLFGIVIYWLGHGLWDPLFMKEIGIVIFLPILIHLIMDGCNPWDYIKRPIVTKTMVGGIEVGVRVNRKCDADYPKWQIHLPFVGAIGKVRSIAWYLTSIGLIMIYIGGVIVLW